jgi:hypothetical protein
MSREVQIRRVVFSTVALFLFWALLTSGFKAQESLMGAFRPPRFAGLSSSPAQNRFYFSAADGRTSRGLALAVVRADGQLDDYAGSVPRSVWSPEGWIFLRRSNLPRNALMS